MASRMKIGVLGATLETPNLGVSTLAVGAVRCILFAYPEARVFFLDYDRETSPQYVPVGTASVRVPLLQIRFSKRFWLQNHILVLLLSALLMKLAPMRRLRQRWANSNPCLAAICSADRFVAVSGGDSFSDVYGIVRFVYVALPQILVILLGKPLILLPQTYGPFRRSSTRMVARWIVTHAEQSWCRDPSSLAHLMQVPASHARWGETACAYDLGFSVDPIPPAQLSIEGLAIPSRRNNNLAGVNVSGLLFQGGYTGRNEFSLTTNYRTLSHAIVARLLAHPEASVLLIPHVAGSATDVESDTAACEAVYAALRSRYPGRIGILRGSYTPSEMRSIVGLCGFFVGSRMHACIAAIAQHVPAVSVAYSGKFRGVMQTIGMPSLVADASSLSRHQILAAIERAWESRLELSRELGLVVPGIRQAAIRLLSQTDAVPLDVRRPAVPA